MPHRAPNLPSSSSPPKGIRSLPHFTVCPFRCNDDGLAHRANATTFGDKTSSRRISFVVIECWRENFSKKRVDLRRQLWRHSRSFPQVKGKFLCERSSVVELHLAKVNVEGSNPFARSILNRMALLSGFFIPPASGLHPRPSALRIADFFSPTNTNVLIHFFRHNTVYRKRFIRICEK